MKKYHLVIEITDLHRNRDYIESKFNVVECNYTMLTTSHATRNPANVYVYSKGEVFCTYLDINSTIRTIFEKRTYFHRHTRIRLQIKFSLRHMYSSISLRKYQYRIRRQCFERYSLKNDFC